MAADVKAIFIKESEYRKSKATFHVAPAPPSTPEYAFFESLRQREEALLKKHSPQ